jgi:AcrR family transcriptional regulator
MARKTIHSLLKNMSKSILLTLNYFFDKMKVFTCMEVIKLDETSQKIIDAAMMLVRDNGYVATTTKAIAKAAGVNECTLFRKFKNKKDIVLQGVSQAGWRANITPEVFEYVQWDLQSDIEMFMRAYMDRMTPDFVNLSIGLRAPQLYEETSALIMKVPQAFLSSFTQYLNKMFDLGKIPKADFDALALTIFSSTFGYAFLNASFGDELSKVEKDEYIKSSVQMFIKGLEQ